MSPVIEVSFTRNLLGHMLVNSASSPQLCCLTGTLGASSKQLKDLKKAVK
jgi:hypothetical protein